MLHLNSEAGSTLHSQQEIEREIAIYTAMLKNDEFMGENFANARRKLLGKICRPTDIHIVETQARQLYNKGIIVMKGRMLLLVAEKALDRLELLMRSIDDNPGLTGSEAASLQAQILDLTEQMRTTTTARSLTHA